MQTRDVLLRAILEDPLDDFHRLAFADHLEEEGRDAEATYLRRCLRCSGHGHECRIDIPPERCACCLLAAEETELGNQQKTRTPLPFNDAQWQGIKSGFSAIAVHASRGFVGAVDVSRPDFLRLHTLFRVFPITSVRFFDANPRHCGEGPDDMGGDSRYVPGIRDAWCWYRGATDTIDLPLAQPQFCDVLPRSLFLALQPTSTDWLDYGMAVYDNALDAKKDLSRACVSLMRRQVGLPELPPI